MTTELVRKNLLSFFLNLRQWPKAEIFLRPDFWYSLTDVPLANFNNVHCHNPVSAGRVEKFAAMYRGVGVPAIWRMWPGQESMVERLEASGFVYHGSALGMARRLDDLPDPPQTALTIEPAAHLSEWVKTFAAGFEMSNVAAAAYLDYYRHLDSMPLYHYIGRLDGQPVATASIWADGTTAGLYNVATLPEMRGRGFGTAISIDALRRVAGRGCGLATLQASEAGGRIYRRLGFEAVCRIGHYIL